MDAARRPSRAHGDKPTNTERRSASPGQLAAPESADLNKLRCEWRRLYCRESPRFSYRLQEIEHGGLNKSTRRKLKTLAKMFETTGRMHPTQG